MGVNLGLRNFELVAFQQADRRPSIEDNGESRV